MGVRFSLGVPKKGNSMKFKAGDYVTIEIGKIIGFTSDGKAVVEFSSFPDDLQAYDTKDLYLFSPPEE